MTGGVYTVEFDKSTLPAGYAILPSDQGGDDDADSDASPDTGRTAQITLAAGEELIDVDAGIQ